MAPTALDLFSTTPTKCVLADRFKIERRRAESAAVFFWHRLDNEHSCLLGELRSRVARYFDWTRETMTFQFKLKSS